MRAKKLLESEPLDVDKIKEQCLRAWSLIGDIPGLPLKPARRRVYLRGGWLFWLIIGTFYAMAYAVIIFYALVFFGFRLAVALLATLLLLLGLLANRVRGRRIANYQKKMARTAMK